MEDNAIAEDLQAVVAQIDAVRRSLMADEPRRRTYLQAIKAQETAERLLAQATADRVYRFAAE